MNHDFKKKVEKKEKENMIASVYQAPQAYM